MNNKKKMRGFTMVELLSTIVIIGILSAFAIAAVSKLINKSKQTSDDTQVKTIEMAAKSYYQNNTQYMPKSIGSSTIVYASVLKSSKYLTDDLVNSSGENCMSNSFVKVYKKSNSEYTYTGYIYCGDDKPSKVVKTNTPTFTVEFIGTNDQVSTSGAKINLYGDNSIGSNGNIDPQTVIDSYSWSISVNDSNTNSTIEVYNSGTLSGNNEKQISLNINFNDYVDLSGYTNFSIKIEIINKDGLSFSGTSDKDYSDNNPPNCTSDINGAASLSVDGSNNVDESGKIIDYKKIDWINKSDGNDKINRVITVGCLDNDGESGCKRSEFSSSWPTEKSTISKFGVDYGYIYIYDNRDEVKNSDVLDINYEGQVDENNNKIKVKEETGNYNVCGPLNVFVDTADPLVAITSINAINESETKVNESNAYAGDVDYAKAAGLSNYKNSSFTIKADDLNYYNNLKETNYWMNKENYSKTDKDYGVTYTVKVSDNLYLGWWKWETNDSLITSNIDKTTNTNGDGKIGYFDSSKNSAEIKVSFTLEGKRYGKLTVYDAAGNSTTVYIYANIDVTAPPVPTIAAYHGNSGKKYTFATGITGDAEHKYWSNNSKGIRVVATGTNNDNLNTASVDLSGHSKYQYQLVYNGKESGWNDTTKNATYVTQNGDSTIQFRACDKAGNCGTSDENKVASERLLYDSQPPSCSVSSTTDSGSYNGEWTKQNVRVTGTCTDSNGSNKDSGCTGSIHYDYENDIETSTAGAAGVKQPGLVSDYAGNTTTCSEYKKVRIDKTPPVCTTKSSVGGSDYNGTWTNQTVKVYAYCTDNNGKTKSGCNDSKNNKIFHEYKKEDGNLNTTNAGVGGVGAGGEICDNADNCTSCDGKKTVKIDITPPTCTISSTTSSGSYDGNWTNETVTVKANCSDTGGSGCADVKNSSVKHEYNSDISTINAGAGGDNVGGTIYDNAGNPTDCTPNKIVNIDKDSPTCVYDGQNTNWTKKSITVSLKCSDTGGSGCNDSGSTEGIYKTETFSNKKNANFSAYTLYDNAGNSKICNGTVNVYSDQGNPTAKCYVSDKTVYSSSSDSLSGISSTQTGWNGGLNSAKTGCGEKNDGYIYVCDSVGNCSSATCSGYTNDACCSTSNPTGCPRTTSCRKGWTAIHSTSYSWTDNINTVRHFNSNCKNPDQRDDHHDYLYIISTSGTRAYVYFSSSCSNGNYGWIETKCLSSNYDGGVCGYYDCQG